MTSQEMMKAKLAPGNWFVNVAALGDSPHWEEQAKPIDFEATGNPNSPAYADRIFGYETEAFLRKQYK